jgi:hypothetical protein
MIEEHRGRREGEPAAAPLETDAESGGASAVSGMPDGEAPRDPAKPYLEARERGDAAAAPGKPDAVGSVGWLKWVIGGLVVLAVIYAAMQI